MRPDILHCQSREPHDAHNHRDGPDGYFYRCPGVVTGTGDDQALHRVTATLHPHCRHCREGCGNIHPNACLWCSMESS